MRKPGPAPVAHAGWLGIAVAVVGAGAVVMAALGAHALEGVSSRTTMQIWHIAVRFQFWHALALAVAAVTARRTRVGLLAASLFAIGIVLFCGGLYALALGAPRAVGFCAPFGGVALLAGWIALGVALYRQVGGNYP